MFFYEEVLMRRNLLSRGIAITLSAVLFLSSVDFRVFAEGELESKEEKKKIIKIEELDEDILNQTLDFGAEENEISFPDALNVTVSYEEEQEIKVRVEKTEKSATLASSAASSASSIDDSANLASSEYDDASALGSSDTEEAAETSTDYATEAACIDEELPDITEPEESNQEEDIQEPEESNLEEDTQEQEESNQEEDTQEQKESNQEEDAQEQEKSTGEEGGEEGGDEGGDEDGGETGEESDSAMLDLIFPALRVYAASDEATIEDSSEEELFEDEEGFYKLEKEIVNIEEDVTIENITWKLDIENSSFDEFNSNEAGAEYKYVPEFSDEYILETDAPSITVVIKEKEIVYEYAVLEASGVKVEGNLPVGSELVVSEISMDEAKDLFADGEREVVYALDISVVLDGEEIELDESVKVTIIPPENIDTDSLRNDDFQLIHVKDENEKEVVATDVDTEGNVNFETDSFSPYGFTLLAATPTTYEVEYSDKSFSQNVHVVFSDASLIVGNESKVTLKLLGNINGKNVKKQDSELTADVIEIASLEQTVNGIIDDGSGNTTASVDFSFSGIPAYIEKGSGAAPEGTGQYTIPPDFYGIQITTADGYSVSKGLIGSDTYFVLSPMRDLNEAAWTTSTIAIENSILALVSPLFTVEWQDNRNYADLRPFTTGTSIEGKESAIAGAIELYYKNGTTYEKVTASSPILVSPGSNVPTVVGGPFSWNIAYSKLPMYMTDGTTKYDWYIKLSDSFYDGKKDYYQLNGLNADGYLSISESGADEVSLVFTNSVNGSITWRIGQATEESLPALPAENTLFSDGKSTMHLYMVAGSNPAEEVTSGFSINWTKGTDTEGKTVWSYSITGLPLYNSDGDAILYYTVITSSSDANYKFTYDNGADSTETDKCLPGQKIYATAIGDAEFTFKKVWCDDNDQDSIDRRALAIQKGITFYLWRYPSNGTLSDGAPVTYNAKQYSFSLSSEHANSSEITFSFADFAGSSVNFPRFDEMGYTYNYYVTEVSKSELYKTVYFNGEGSFNGESSDKVALNNGRVCNVRSAKIAPAITKNWNVSAISDYVGSTCEFTLQRKEGSEWVDVETKELSGFSSSKKKVSGSFAAQELYDSLGKKYEYRVIESAVTSGSGAAAEFDASGWKADENTAGKYSALYTLGTEPYEYSYKAVSTYKTSVENGVESAEATIVNKLYGTKKLSMQKTWSGNWGIETENDYTGNVHLLLYRAVDGENSSVYASIILNKPEENASSGTFNIHFIETDTDEVHNYTVTKTTTTTGSSYWTWKTEDLIVPAYTDEGQQYVYTMLEEYVENATEQGIHYGKDYNKSVTGKRIDLSVTNYTGSQTSKTRIDVSKIWKDDSDTSQRSTITVLFGTYDDAGVFTQVYEAGDTEKPYKLTLTSANDYANYIWVDGNDFKAEGSEEDAAEAIKKHLSIKLTDGYGRTVEKATYSNNSITGGVLTAIENGDSFKPGYKVDIVRNDTGTSFKITNTRVGSRAFTFTKIWEDSANHLGLRGDFLRVALFREVNDTEKEVAFIDIPTYSDEGKTTLTSGNALTVTFKNGNNYYPAYDENGNNYIYSVKEYLCTGTPKASETLCDENGIEDDAANIVKTELDLNATKDTTTTGYVVEKDVETPEYSLIDGTNDFGYQDVKTMLMSESYKYTNRAAGERGEVSFYVIWHDQAKSNERPDIYYTLYYDGGENGALIPYTGSYTERWEHVESGNKFIQKAVFSGLPAADDNGKVYTYYVTETFNNATSQYNPEHYTEPLRNSTDTDYNSEAVDTTTVGTDKQLLVKETLRADKDTVKVGNLCFTKEDSFTLISISDTVKIEGRKLWVGVPDGIDVGNLPLAHIYLFRDSSYDHSRDVPDVSGQDQAGKMATYEAGSVAQISTDDGSKSPQELNTLKSMYVYGTYNDSRTVVSTYAEFPKYDSLGYLYTYKVREVIYNTLEGHNELPAEIMIPHYSDNTTDLTNQYKLNEATNKRNFKIIKDWTIDKKTYQEVVAKATFRLYRKELESDGHGYTNGNYADDTNSNDIGSSIAAAAAFNIDGGNLELLDTKIIAYNKNATEQETITWENYPIFAPSGKLYAYYAVELTDDMPGYDVKLIGGGDGIATTGNTMISGSGYIGVAFANSGVSLANTAENNLKTETFKNTYKPKGFYEIQFTKVWEAKNADGTTWTDMLPQTTDDQDALSFEVYAIANTQSGKENPDKITFTSSDYNIEKVSSVDGTTWTYTIRFRNANGDPIVAPIYSVNGNLYTYYVKETLNSDFVKANYKIVTQTVYSKASNVVSDVLTLGSLKNSLKGSFSIQKMWDDYSNDYGMREGSITFDVYYRLAGSSDWTKYNNSPYSLSSSSKWAKTLTGLPVTANSNGSCGANYEYRIREVGIVDKAGKIIEVSSPADEAQTTTWTKNGTSDTDSDLYCTRVTAGNYQVYNPADITSIKGTSPTKKLVNQLDTSRAVVSLTVTKNWNDDSDKYGLRPTRIYVTIQNSKDGGDNWADVTTKEITDSELVTGTNTWSKTFENLPKFYGTGDSDIYHYRVKETKIGNVDTTGTYPNLSGGSYSIVHSTSKDTNGNFTTTVTNTLVPMDKSIRVLKRWNADPSDATISNVKVALFSNNYTGGDPSSAAPTQISNIAEITLSNGAEYEYAGLPKFNKDGKLIRYYVKETTTGNFKTQYLSGSGDTWPTGTAADALKYTSSDITDDFRVVVVNTPLTIVTGTKVWDDDNNKYSIRPSSIVLTLQSKTDVGAWTTVTGKTVTLNATNNWTGSISNLPLYVLSDGTSPVKYQYRLAELSTPNAYTRDTSVSAFSDTDDYGYSYDGSSDSQQKSSVTNHLIKRTDAEALTVQKVWNTNSTSDIEEVTVKLLSRNLSTGADSTTGTLSVVPGCEVKITGNDTHVFNGLPKYNKTGNEIVYYVEETANSAFDTAYYIESQEGFTKVSKAAAKSSGTGSFAYKIVNTPLTSITGTKIWSDDNNAYGLRPASVSLTLQRRLGEGDWVNVEGQSAKEVNQAGNWKATVSNLPLYELSDGSSPVKYQYRLAELVTPNAYTRDKSKDASEFTATDNISYIYGGSDTAQTSSVTNFLITRTNPLTVEKIWNTNNTADKNNVTVNLYSGNFASGDDNPDALLPVKHGTVAMQRVLTGTPDWKSTFEDLPLVNKDGKTIVYYISETEGSSYTTEYYVYNGSSFDKVDKINVKSSGADELKTQIVNTPHGSASVEKKWSDGNNKYKTRPDSIFAKLQRKAADETTWVDVTTAPLVELNEGNSWKGSVDDLVLYKDYNGSSPVKYEYRFIETDSTGAPYVPLGYSLVSAASEYIKETTGDESGYVTSFDETTDTYKTVITNTLITKDVTAIKHWEDESDSHGIRPSMVRLFVTEDTEVATNSGAFNSEVLGGVSAIKPYGENPIMLDTPKQRDDDNTWVYVFEGLPRYVYGNGAPQSATEIVYKVSEDTEYDYGDGFILKNYYETTAVRTGDTTDITNTAMENDGSLIIEKVIEQDPITYGFKFEVSLIRPDGAKVPFKGEYYLYSASEVSGVSDSDLRNDAMLDTSAYTRSAALTSTDGVVRAAAGQIAVLVGINSRYTFEVTENPSYVGYEVTKVKNGSDEVIYTVSDSPTGRSVTITGSTGSTYIEEDADKGGYYGFASGAIADKDSDPCHVVFTNSIFDPASHYLKVENTTEAITDDEGNIETGGEVKTYKKLIAVDRENVDYINDDEKSYTYVNDATPFIEEAMSVEFKPDEDNGYTYSDTLTVGWWDQAGDYYSVDISGYVYTNEEGKQEPYTGTLIKDDEGNITASSEDILSVWGSLLENENSPFKNVTILSGSVVVTLASDINDMPAKTLVQVSFVAPQPEPEPEPEPEPDPGSDPEPTPTPLPTPTPTPEPTPGPMPTPTPVPEPTPSPLPVPTPPTPTPAPSSNLSEDRNKDEDNSSDSRQEESSDNKSTPISTTKKPTTDAQIVDDDQNNHIDGSQKAGVRTSDDTPVGTLSALFLLFMLAFAAVLATYLRIRKKKY